MSLIKYSTYYIHKNVEILPANLFPHAPFFSQYLRAELCLLLYTSQDANCMLMPLIATEF